MRILYAKSFDKDIDSVRHDKEAKKRLLETIKNLKHIASLNELQGVKKIGGYTSYYRIRIGNYRLGVKLAGDALELIRFLHRKDIHRRFP